MGGSDFVPVTAKIAELSKTNPDRLLLRFADAHGAIIQSYTCAEIFKAACETAHWLSDHHSLKAGDRVLLVYPPGLEFTKAFLACLLLRVIPVPVAPPHPLRPELGLPGYLAIAKQCEAKAQLTQSDYSRSRSFGRILQALRSGPRWPELPWILTDQARSEIKTPDPQWEIPKADDIAYLQYTSGSTRAPKGVCITFGNLWAQTQLLKNDNQMKWDRTSVFWMPHYHDFALVGGIVCALSGNYDTVLLAPESFLRKPSLWGDLLHQFKASHTGSPDFGYRLFTLKTSAEERARWDLSHLDIMMTAAEPIRAKTVDEMVKAFQVAKLSPESVCPSYGLAEHTVAVALNGKKRFWIERASTETMGEKVKLTSAHSPLPSMEVFGCGPPCQGVEVRIVDSNRLVPVPENHLGEVWVSSLSKAKGYFNQPIETKEKFEAKLEGSSTEWLRTGDIGVMLDNELVILGRIDDQISFRGKNIFPQDIEGTVSEMIPEVRAGRVLSFGLSEDEKVFVLLELKNEHASEKDFSSVALAARTLLLQEIGMNQLDFVFVPHGTLPKTTSGKLRRNLMKQRWLQGEVKYLHWEKIPATLG
jgi:acyl-CoA synthetase (AMP-forming)/AMP-acid ligase II